MLVAREASFDATQRLHDPRFPHREAMNDHGVRGTCLPSTCAHTQIAF
jgi:hypothetical protein